RYMDKLMGTSFFHESNFRGLIEKVRERGRASTTQRMTEQINRLFSTGSEHDTSLLSPIKNDEQTKLLQENTSHSMSLNNSKNEENNLDNINNKEETQKADCDKLISDEIKNSSNKSSNNCNLFSSKDAILNSSETLSENLANLSLSSGKVPASSSKV
ncbi:unnamed protein product, partial [Meganyctiphanes norvegica]